MPFCTNCGNENSPDVRFCGVCGTEQFPRADVCVKCRKTLEENEKFCSVCGTLAGAGTETKEQTKPIEEKLTKEGRKIITGTSKPGTGKRVSPSPVSRPNKKKRGCLGCFFQTILILLIIVAVVIGVKFILAKINSTSFGKSDSLEIINTGNKNNLVVPGGDTTKKDKPFESQELKEITAEFESILENADIEKFKLMLSESARKIYEGELDQLKPNLPEYGKMFKKRKLVTSTDFFKVYEFTGDDGKTYSATFEFQPGDTWRLVRF